jgi:hypothetical protein
LKGSYHADGSGAANRGTGAQQKAISVSLVPVQLRGRRLPTEPIRISNATLELDKA